MYQEFFELTRRPFASTPDTASYCPTAPHEGALGLLKGCLHDNDGIGVLVGAPGSGKTLMAHKLLDSWKSTFTAVFLNNPHSSSVGALFQGILYDLYLPYHGIHEQEMRLRLCEFVMERFRAGHRTVILVDEAHHLAVEQLEELRLLTNLESRNQKALQVLLFGQISLLETLEHGQLAALRQRVAAVSRLEALDERQTLDYIRRQLSHAGGKVEAIFSPRALADIVQRAEGCPRRINQLCHRAMLLAYVHQSASVEVNHVSLAAAQLLLPTQVTNIHVHHPETQVVTRTPSEPVVEPAKPQPSVLEVGAGCAQDVQRLFPKEFAVVGEPTVIEWEPEADSKVLPAERKPGGSRVRQLFAN